LARGRRLRISGLGSRPLERPFYSALYVG